MSVRRGWWSPRHPCQFVSETCAGFGGSVGADLGVDATLGVATLCIFGLFASQRFTTAGEDSPWYVLQRQLVAGHVPKKDTVTNTDRDTHKLLSFGNLSHNVVTRDLKLRREEGMRDVQYPITSTLVGIQEFCRDRQIDR